MLYKPRKLDKPHQLLSLPLSFSPPHDDKTFASSVLSFRKNSFRLPAEIVTAINGYGIDLYDIRSCQSITSFPVPPKSLFTCAPCSISLGLRGSKTFYRATYACTQLGPNSLSFQLLCFIISPSTDTTEHFSYDVSSYGAIHSIHLLPGSHDDNDTFPDYDVLLVSNRGELLCLSRDLKILRWHISNNFLAPLPHSSVSVSFASLVTFSQAVGGFLKDRADLCQSFKALQASAESQSRAYILCVITYKQQAPTSQNSPTHQAFLSIFAVASRVNPAMTSTVQNIVNLIQEELPIQLDQDSLYSASWSLDVNYELLYCLDTHHFNIIELKSVKPKLLSSITLPAVKACAFLEVAPSLILFLSPCESLVYDLRFGSVLARGHTDEHENVCTSTNHKRKRRNSNENPPQLTHDKELVSLIAFYTSARSAIGIWGNKLCCLNLDFLNLTGKHHRYVSRPKLIDSIGKGLSKSIILSPHLDGIKCVTLKLDNANKLCNDETGTTNWNAKKAMLETLISEAEVDKFEREMANILHIEEFSKSDITDPQKCPRRYPHKPCTENEKIETDQDESTLNNYPLILGLDNWNFYANSDLHGLKIHEREALFAMSQMFRWVNTPESAKFGEVRTDDGNITTTPELEIKFLMPNVLKWLIFSGHFTINNIDRAGIPSSTNQTKPVTPWDVISAIVKFDRSMRLLHDILHIHTYLDISSVIQVIKILILSLNNESLDQQELIETDEITPAPVNQGYQDENLEKSVIEEFENANRDIDTALIQLEHGTMIRGQSLRKALLLLHSFPFDMIASHMRRELSVSHIIFLIQILRLEIVNGGWTLRYIDNSSKRLDPNGSQFDIAISIISDLLSCALNAIGMAGWHSEVLTSCDNSDEHPNATILLISLQKQVSLALEGLHETVFLQGLLRNFGEYIDDVQRYLHSRPGNNTGSVPQSIIHNYTDQNIAFASFLPMGCFYDHPEHLSRLSNPKPAPEKSLSRRDRGIAMNKRIEKYSLDQIRF